MSVTHRECALVAYCTEPATDEGRDQSSAKVLASGETYQQTVARLRKPLDFGNARSFNFAILIEERKRHETDEAKSAVTYRYNNALATGALDAMQAGDKSGAAATLSGDSSKLKVSLVSQITRVMSASLSFNGGGKGEGKAEASGVERKSRWRAGLNGERGVDGAREQEREVEERGQAEVAVDLGPANPVETALNMTGEGSVRSQKVARMLTSSIEKASPQTDPPELVHIGAWIPGTRSSLQTAVSRTSTS